MNTSAIKRMEIANSLSHIPDHSLEKIQAFVDDIASESEKSKQFRGSLKGIWRDKGFEKITDLDEQIIEARRQLGESILNKRF